MGAQSTDGIVPRRSKLRAYLLLARVSNLPTIWTNVLAAWYCAMPPSNSIVDYTADMRPSIGPALWSMVLFYMAGMFLNDACDAPFDAQARADRPIPAGDVSRWEALAIAILLFVAGEIVLLGSPLGFVAAPWSLALIVAIVAYNLSHKGKWYGPIVMGLCRALVYFVAAASVIGTVPTAVVAAAIVMWLYVIALSWVAKAANLGYAVPWMLAGICLVDALVILVVVGESGIVSWSVALLFALPAAAGFPLTLALQRVVPGT
jgi:4-hydroxybenzoate polyprenyltransferase